MGKSGPRVWNAGDTAGTPRTRALAAALRQARTTAGFGVRELARKLDLSHTTVSQWETGKRLPTTEDVSSYLTVLGVTGKRRKEIIELARHAADPNWLSSGMPQAMAGLLECERTATEIIDWSPMVVSGLLQTADYARAIFEAHDRLQPKEVEDRVQTRMDRRNILYENRGELPSVELTTILGEWAVKQRVGGSRVQVEQLKQVLKVARLPHVTVRVLPIGEGWHPGLMGPFNIFNFASGSTIVLAEHHRSSAFLYDDRISYISDYKLAADKVCQLALDKDESADYISEYIRELKE